MTAAKVCRRSEPAITADTAASAPVPFLTRKIAVAHGAIVGGKSPALVDDWGPRREIPCVATFPARAEGAASGPGHHDVIRPRIAPQAATRQHSVDA